MADRDFKVRHGLNVCGNSSLGGNVTISGDLATEGADLGTFLSVSGTASLGALRVAGMTSLQGGLVVGAESDFQATIQANSISANGNLQVNGTASLKGALTVSGMTSLQGLVVGAESDFQSKISANTISASASVIVDQQVQADGDVIAGQVLRAGGSLCAQAQAFVNNDLRVTQNTDLNGTLTVCGATTLSSTLTVASNTDLNGTLTVSGATTISGKLTIPFGPSTIAAGTFDNGWFRIGNSTTGIAMDSNEIYFAGDGALGTLSGSLVLNPAGSILTQKSFDSTNNIETTAIISGTQLRCVSFSGTTVDIAGTLQVSSATSVGGSLTVTGATNLNSTADIAGSLQVSGGTSIGGSLKVAGDICSVGHVIAGDTTSGRISLSINDGYGNANVTFNHHKGIPDVAGNAARIETSVDQTTSSFITLEVGSGLQAGVAQSLQTAATFYANRTEINGELQALANADINGTLQASGNTSLGGTLTVSGTTSLQSDVDINGTLAVSGAISAPGGLHAVTGDIQTEGTISGTQLKFVSAGGQRMTVSNLDSVSGRVGTLSATQFNFTSAGGQRMTVSEATIGALSVSTITVNQQGNIARRISGTVIANNSTYVTAFTVDGNSLASCIEAFFEGTINNVVVACHLEVISNHSGDITIRTHQGNYTPLDIRVVSDNNEDFAVLVKRSTATTGDGTITFNVYPKGDETVTATSTNPYSGTTLTHTGARGTKITATGGQPHRFETDGEIIGGQTLTVSGSADLNTDLSVSGTLSVGGLAHFDNNVGIGTTAPITSLEVAATDAPGDPRIKLGSLSDAHPFVELNRWTGVGTSYYGVRTRSFLGDYTIETGGTGTLGGHSYTERFRVTSTGNVGIGTLNPSEILHVYGSDPQIQVQHNTGFAGPAGFNAKAAGTNSSANASYYQMNGGSMWGQTGNLGIRFGPSDRSAVNMLIKTTNGNVAIGTENPTTNLHVMGNQTRILVDSTNSSSTVGLIFGDNGTTVGGVLYSNADDALYFQTNGFNERARITTDGKLLIGTSSSLLNIVEGGVQLQGTAGDACYTATRYSTSVNGSAAIVLGRSKSATKGTNTIVANDDRLGDVFFSGADGSGFVQAASIQGFVDGTPGTNDMPGRLVFSTTADGASSTTERMRIDSDGNARFTQSIRTTASNGTTIIGEFARSSLIVTGGTQDDLGIKADGHMLFAAGGTTERLRISSAGLVGIGTDNPQYNLEVNGSFAATTKSFLIEHPTKPNYKLRYGSLESPYHGIRLTGYSIIKNGISVIELPEYIYKLVKRRGVNIQITNIKHNKIIWVEEINVSQNNFVVKTEEQVGEYEFFWDFTATRTDIEDMIVEISED